MRLPLLLLLEACAYIDPAESEPADSAVLAPGTCVGQWFQRTNDVVDGAGEQVLDADGRVVEETSTAAGSQVSERTWWVWGTDASGTDRLTETGSDLESDGIPEAVVRYTWGLDEALRLAWLATSFEGAYEVTVTYTYDDEDQVIATARSTEGGLFQETFSVWEDGRIVSAEGFQDGELVGTSAFTYAAPAPALDHVAEVRSVYFATTLTRRAYDALGRLVGEWRVLEDGDALVVTQVWDEQGRLAEDLRPLTGSIGSVGTIRTVRTWDDDGLLEEVRAEEDDFADGTIDSVRVQEWTWTCG